jgi:hypothetical protein
MSVCVVNIDEGNSEGVCDDMLDMEKIVTVSNPKGIKLSKEEEQTYSWQHYTFWHAVICILA